MSARRRSEDGYALLIVLVSCMMFGLIVVALLAMVNTDALASRAYVMSDSAKRAVDGGLQLGIAQVKSVQSSTLDGTSPCTGFPADSQITVEGKTLDIDCTDAADPTLPAPRALPAADPTDTSPVLTLRDGWDSAAVVPDQYSQTWEQTYSFPGTTCTGLRLAPLVKCLNDNATLPALSQVLWECRNGDIVQQGFCPIRVAWRVLSGGAGLMHIADSPLEVYGGVDASKWGLVTGVTPGASSGLEVTGGQYRQGESDGSCSATVLAELGNLQPPRTGVASPGASCAPFAPTATPPAPTATTTVGTVPTTAACASGGVVAIDGGAFDAAKVAALNALFAAPACNNVTFWFKPGAFYFDAASPFVLGALNLNNATSNFVFGEPRGWVTTARAPDSIFPEACNRETTGVSIVLGSTTSIVHNNGAVAICGDISQVAGQPTLAPVTYTAGLDVAAPGLLTAPGAWHRWLSTWPMGGFSGPGAAAGDRPISSAQLRITGATTNVQPSSVEYWWVATYPTSQSRVTFTRGAKTCTVTKATNFWDSWPFNNAVNPFVVDLLVAGSPCRGVITTQADVEEGTFSIDFDLNRSCTSEWWGWNCPPATINLTGATIVTESLEFKPLVPMPMTLQSDPSNHRTFNVFGSVELPNTQIDVKWWQPTSAAPVYELPIFVGNVDAKALFSHPGNDSVPTHIGPLASKTLQPLERRVRITVSMNGRVLGSTLVSIVDEDSPNLPAGPPTGPAGPIAAAAGLTTSDWAYCNLEIPAGGPLPKC